MVRIADHDQLLGKHLDKAIHTGASCVYTPDPRVPARWTT
jgi:hypothetical protein